MASFSSYVRYWRTRKLLSLVIPLILVLAVAAGVYLVRREQDIRNKAATTFNYNNRFQEQVVFTFDSACKAWGYFTTDIRTQTQGCAFPSTIQFSNSSLTLTDKGGVLIENPLRTEPLSSTFYKIQVTLVDANQQSLTAFLTAIDNRWSATTTTNGISIGIDTANSRSTYWNDHTQFKTSGQVSSSQYSFSRKAQSKFQKRTTGNILLEYYVTPNGIYAVVNGSNYASLPNLYTGSYLYANTNPSNYIVLNKINTGGDSVTFKDLKIIRLDNAVSSVDDVNAYFLKRTVTSPYMSTLESSNPLWAAFVYRGYDYYYGTNNQVKVQQLYDSYITKLKNNVALNLPRYGSEETIQINHGFINNLQADPIVTYGLYGYLRSDQRESARVEYAKVADKIMEYTRPYDSNYKFKFPYGVHYLSDTFGDESSWILSFLSGYYSSFSADKPRADKVLEYIRFFGFLNLSDGKSIRDVYGYQTFTYMPATFQDFVGQYIWPTGEVDNHGFHPSINYATGLIHANSIARNLLAKKGITLPELARNLTTAYTKNFSGLLDSRTLRSRSILPNYNRFDNIIFENYGDLNANKSSIVVNTSNRIHMYLNSVFINKTMSQIRLFATKDSGVTWTEITPAVSDCSSACEREWTWTPTTTGQYTLIANVIYTDGTACSGNPYVSYPYAGFTYCGDADHMAVTVGSSSVSRTNPTPVNLEDLYYYNADGSISGFAGYEMPSLLEDWGNSIPYYSVAEDYGDYALATTIAKSSYFLFYSGGGMLFCDHGCTMDPARLMFEDALYTMLTSPRTLFDPLAGPVLPTSSPRPTNTVTPLPTNTPTPTVCTVPPVPAGLTPSGTTSCGLTSMTFRWNAMPGASSYALRIDDLSNPWSGTCSSINNGDTCVDGYTSTSYTRSVIPGHTYTWWVHSANACGWSQPIYVTATVPVCATNTPTATQTSTPTPLPTATPTPTPTSVIASNTPTKTPTPVIATNTSTPRPSNTATATATSTVTSTPAPLPGDANNDGVVDGADYIPWLTHYNQTISGTINGDFNGNGKVDGVDYVIWFTNYGNRR